MDNMTAKMSCFARAYHFNRPGIHVFEELERVLQDAGFLIYEHLDETEMTEQFFAAYNSGSPAHTMTAPKGVGYITAINKENKN